MVSHRQLSGGAAQSLPGEGRAGAKVQRGEGIGARRVLQAAGHGWNRRPVAGAQVMSSGHAGEFALYMY